MARKGRKVLPQEQAKMWELYQKLGSYKAVAKAMNRNPDTVSKHCKIYETAIQVATVLR